MSVYHTLCFLSAAAMLIAFVNSKIGKMQTTIAITAGSMVLSLLILIAGQNNWFHLTEIATETVTRINFEDFLLKGILGFLLFAGGLGIKLPNLKDQKWEITVLALAATLFSTFFIGFALYGICLLIGIKFDLIYCLLFGSLISPTDPIAVLAIVKKLDAPKRISTQIEGESLFNDGFGLVIFVTLFTIAFGTEAPTVGSVTMLFIQEAIGGIFYGFLLGLLFHYLISATNDHSMELLLTIGVPTAGYAFAEYLHVSGPLAMVVSGIMIGNWTRFIGFSKESEDHLDHFWELVDEFLNGVLFLLIGMSMLLFKFHQEDWIMMAIAVPLVLASRYLSVFFSYIGFKRYRTYNRWSVKILTWGGLRGGLALAMALSIPSGIWVVQDKLIDVKEIILVMTYAVVVFSILIQGSTITPMIEKAKEEEKKMEEERNALAASETKEHSVVQEPKEQLES
ncbi:MULTISPECIES: cation:proton antiporter [Vibrio]|jgi:CPA1 family monovalent cation:H+ antiporter|uniref:Sodium:proton antiporter n=2 Tax=Vibrio harveyi group TaxID=717610 RepID=A0AAN0Y430_VIBNA|nr:MULTISPECIES: sodium:proton antiporter [Vibrio]MEE3880501.1 sodium:proton antiporter [Vibrio sp. YYF0003]ALR14504.1 sodium:proton antiporter [Vibrio natriegens NBRC 15636 = ATCC 14048 = DSM 759]ANQ13632.1 sodium:proton antiporter [Vibrio natriegens NBRC 15636 = ATCC 14048 = DSM 759]MCG9702798.1 sodium:proton antiporter [Vibrio natriegens]MDX6028077.1 sodium:proton antiporter [Vibrio natriegens NBRC 15636 = ATCC 14048 = DSM 759]